MMNAISVPQGICPCNAST